VSNPPKASHGIAPTPPVASRGAALAEDAAEPSVVQDQLSLLLDLSETLGGTLDHEMSLRQLAELLVPRMADGCVVDVVDPPPRGSPKGAPLGVRRLAVTCADPEKAELSSRLMRLGPPDPSTPMGILHVLRTGKPSLTRELDQDSLALAARDSEHLAVLRALGPRSALVIPLIARTRAIGVLWLYMAESGRRYGARDLELAQDMARRAALALDNARLFNETILAVRVRDDFLSVASHELRTPLTSLLLLVQGLLRRPTTDPAVLAAKHTSILHQGERLGALVEQLLDISRITGGRLAIHRSPMDLGKVVRAVVARLGHLAVTAGCALEVEAPDTGPVGNFDQYRVESVVENLLVNAFKFGEGKPVEVCVEQRGQQAAVVVRDHGIGIGQADQARIFEQFERAVSPQHFGGLGLGLWISRQAVEAMGGTIEVESRPGQGSKFTVLLPLGSDEHG
jgi:signal transduction histidine kinase